MKAYAIAAETINDQAMFDTSARIPTCNSSMSAWCAAPCRAAQWRAEPFPASSQWDTA
jgi:hypothetical protein